MPQLHANLGWLRQIDDYHLVSRLLREEGICFFGLTAFDQVQSFRGQGVKECYRWPLPLAIQSKNPDALMMPPAAQTPPQPQRLYTNGATAAPVALPRE